ncbi:MAG: T9SS type A sorting domain-containing protein [Flavobacteriales bacterium]|nr:T9SS type A sorting domain-containing protein [Flavobacteriales bacterium]
MRLNLLLVTIAIAIFSTVQGQSIKILKFDDQSDVSSGTVSKANWVDGLTTIKILLSNTSGDTLAVGYKRYELNVVSGTENYSCSPDLCYGNLDAGTNVIWTAPDNYNFPSDTTLKLYSLYHVSNGNSGTNSYRYVFYAAGNHNDSSYVDVVFETPLSVENAVQNKKELNLYPNPAMDEINVSLSNVGQRDQLVIVDMLGTMVKNSQLTQNTSNINISDLKAGVYFYSLYSNGVQSSNSKRLVIK